jgi:mono/diheme cytochrome c family protein
MRFSRHAGPQPVKFDSSFVVAVALSLLTSVAAAAPQVGGNDRGNTGEAADGPTHADVIRSLNEGTLSRGAAIYRSHCASCHGTDGVASFPAARSFGEEPLRYGADPYRMWETLTEGRGRMPAQDWLTPRERYYAVQYVREALIRPARRVPPGTVLVAGEPEAGEPGRPEAPGEGDAPVAVAPLEPARDAEGLVPVGGLEVPDHLGHRDVPADLPVEEGLRRVVEPCVVDSDGERPGSGARADRDKAAALV